MTTVAEQLAWAKRMFNGQEQPLLEAQVLLAYVLKCDRVKLISWPETTISAEQEVAFHHLVERRAQHEPVAYLVGEKEFWSHSFLVTPDTLIPRPDTEKLVEVALDKLSPSPLTVVDIGTGCGTIACALALMRPQWKVIGVDISEAALAIARLNGERFNLTNVEWLHSRWLSALENKMVDAIVSNPPYLRADDEHLQDGSLSFEPLGALVSGKTGLEAYEIIINQAINKLKVGGHLIFEHGYDQAGQVQALLFNANFNDIETFKDLGGNSRVTVGVR